LGTLALLAPTWWMGLHNTVVMLPRYGRIAMQAAPLVVATGVLTVWTRLENPAQLLSTTYGRLILAKAVLVAIVLFFGARHHRRLTQPLGATQRPDGVARDSREHAAHASRHTLLLELLLAALVLALTGWLGESEPPTLE
jgi:putative copper resistance protein D